MSTPRLRRFVVALALFGLAASAAPAAASNRPGYAGAGDWTMYADGAAHNDVNRSEQALSPATVAGLHLAQTYTKWQPNEEQASPYQIVVGNMGYSVYTAPYSLIGLIMAFHLPAGTVAWHRVIAKNGDDWLYVPAVSNGRLYVGGADAMFAFDAVTGAPLWTTTVAPTNVAPGPEFNPVTVSGTTVYGSTYTTGWIYAFSAARGKILWKVKPAAEIIGPVSVSGGLVYVAGAFTDVALGHLRAYNATTGALVFTSAASTFGDSVAVSNGLAFVQDDTYLEAFNATTGALVWKATTEPGATSGNSSRTPAVDGATVVVSGNQHVEAFAAATGARLWSYDSGSSSTYYRQPALANGVVYVAADTKGLQALSEATGAVLYQSPQQGCDSPIVSHSAVYVTCNGHVVTFTL